jgi:hypothetical protein
MSNSLRSIGQGDMRFLLLVFTCLFAFANSASAEILKMALSSDGARYAALSEADGESYVLVYSVADAQAKPEMFKLGAFKAGSFQFGGSTNVLLRISDVDATVATNAGLQDLNSSRWVSLDIESGESTVLFENLEGWDFNYYIEDSGALLTTLPGNDDEAIFSRVDVQNTGPAGPSRFRNGDDELLFSVHKVSFDSGKSARVKSGGEETVRWVAAADGTILARVDINERAGELRFFTADGGRLKFTSTLALPEDEESEIGLLGSSPETGVLVVRT